MVISNADRPLRGLMSLCRMCGELFGSPTAFDKHQKWNAEKETYDCIPAEKFGEPVSEKSTKPRLVLHPKRKLWVTSLRNKEDFDAPSS